MKHSREEVTALAICEVVDHDLVRLFGGVDASAALGMKFGLMKRLGVSRDTVEKVFKVENCAAFDALRELGELLVADPRHSSLVTRLSGRVEAVVALYAGRPS